MQNPPTLPPPPKKNLKRAPEWEKQKTGKKAALIILNKSYRNIIAEFILEL